MEQLVIRGASVAAQDVKGNTPLHLACGLDGADVVRLLLASGSSSNVSVCVLSHRRLVVVVVAAAVVVVEVVVLLRVSLVCVRKLAFL